MNKMLSSAIRRLAAAGVPDPAWDARELLEWAGGPDRSHLPLWDGSLSEAVLQCFEEGLRRREQRIPLQQITGRTWFMGLPFQVTDQVLCPRPDTEILVERGIALMKDKPQPLILDLCCGSGCIGISLAHYLPKARLVLSDISPEALELARNNAALNKVLDRISFARGDMLEARLEETDRAVKELAFDLICCNPPSIPAGEIETLMPEVRDHEPRIALDGGKDGLDFYRLLAESVILRRALPDEGSHPEQSTMGFFGFQPQNDTVPLLLEIGCEQGAAVTEIFRAAGYRSIFVYQDLAGLDRVVEISL